MRLSFRRLFFGSWSLVRGRKAKRHMRVHRVTRFRPRFDTLEDRTVLSTVTTLDDTGLGSLRDAIATTADGGTVDFADGLTGTITLIEANGPLTIDKDLTITGPGTSVITISGGDATQIFEVALGNIVTISGLTITNGSSSFGGAIINSGDLTLQDVVISNSVATDTGGGIYSDPDGVLTVENSLIQGNTTQGDGGGITNDGEMHLVNVTFFDNEAAYGGAISNLGTFDATNVTISGNHATVWGGGIFTDLQTTSTLVNTIVAGNTADDEGPDLNGDFDNATSFNNLIGDGTTGTGINDGENGNLVGTDLDPIDPLLGTLQDNGGTTLTFALLATSPAIDAGTNTGVPATDQRGFNRIVNTTVDMGAYEYQPPETTISTPTSSLNPSDAGEEVTFTVTVTADAPGSNVVTGTVTFFSDGVELDTVDLVNGTATLAVVDLPPGDNIITATYNGLTVGDYALDSTTSGELTQTVNEVETTTVVTSSVNPSGFGQEVTFTATVTPDTGTGTPTGSVEFFDGVVSLGTATLANGIGTLVISTLTIGDHEITAVFTSDGVFNNSTSDPITQAVEKADTTTVVTSSANPSTFGEQITLTATVDGVDSTATPTGNVEFFDGAVSLGVVALVNGVATLDVSSLTVGDHPITATYAGDTNFNTSTSPALTQTVDKAESAVVVTSSVNPSDFGQMVTFTATVTSDGGTPTGQVEFFDGAVSLGTAPLTAGVATLQVSTLTVGAHVITATYAGDANFDTSTSPDLTQTVEKATVTVALTSSMNPSTLNQQVTFTATLTPSGTGTPTGQVEFFDGAVSLGTSNLVAGVATLQVSNLILGDHVITANYLGDANFDVAESPELTQTVVEKITVTVMLASSANPSTFGQQVTLTATVTPTQGTEDPSGDVEFFDGAVSLGTGTVTDGVATLVISNLSVGSHPIKAVYEGDDVFASGESSPISQVVNKALTSTNLTITPNPANSGQNVTYTATVTPSPSGTVKPTGQVTFVANGSTVIGSANLVDGVATLVSDDLPVGTYTVVAQYSQGDANFESSESAPVNFAVQTATTTTLTSSNNPSTFNENVTFTATVTSTSGTPTGTVTFLDGTVVLGTGTLANGVATFTTKALGVGNHNVTARYEASGEFATSTSSVVKQSVVNGELFAVSGAPGEVRIYRKSDGSLLYSFSAFPDNTSSVSVAWGDITGDGLAELVVATTSTSSEVVIYEGAPFADGTFDEADPDLFILTNVEAYEARWQVGAYVAVNDVNDDGFMDLITAASLGNPHVKIYSGASIADGSFDDNPEAHLLGSWFAYTTDQNLGVTLGTGDVNADGNIDIVTSSSVGSSHIKVYDGASIKAGTFAPNPELHLLVSFIASNLGNNNGAFVAAGDTNGDGFADVIAGAAAGSTDVRVFSGQAIAQGNFNPQTGQLNQFFAYQLQFTVGVTVGAADFNNDGTVEILTGPATNSANFRVVDGDAFGVEPTALLSGTADGINGGINVGV